MTCWSGDRPHPADGYLVDDDGKRVPGFDCREHGEACVKEYREKLGQEWQFVETDEFGNAKEKR